MALYLTRHGQDIAGELGCHNGDAIPTYPTQLGMEQIFEAGEWFGSKTLAQELNITAVYVSPLLRAIITGIGIKSGILRASGRDYTAPPPTSVRPALRERNMGAITGLTDDEEAQYAEARGLKTLPGTRITLGVENEESLPNTSRRVRRAIGRIMTQQNRIGGDGLVILHGMAGRLAIGAYSKPRLSWREAATLRFRNCEVFRIDEAGARSVFIPSVLSREISYPEPPPGMDLRDEHILSLMLAAEPPAPMNLKVRKAFEGILRKLEHDSTSNAVDDASSAKAKEHPFR